MSKQIYNLGQIQREMEKIAELVIRDSTKEILEKFKEDYIQKYVYDSHEPNKVYHNPKGQEFKEAWEWEDIKKSATQISSTMFYNWKKMSNIPHYFMGGDYSGFGGGIEIGIHGSNVGSWDSDERPYLAETLDKTGYSSSLWVSVDRAYAYWQEFINKFVNGGELKRVVDKNAKKHGLTLGGL